MTARTVADFDARARRTAAAFDRRDERVFPETEHWIGAADRLATVLEKTDQKFFAGADVGPVVQAIRGGLYQRGIATQQVGVSLWSGRATDARWAMLPRATLSTYPAPGGFVVQATVSVDFETNGLIVLVVLWVLVFPAAVICAVLAYQEWQKRQTELLLGVWGPVAQRIAAPMPPYAPLTPPEAGPPHVPRGPL
jgi:hypothetical protein